MDGNTVRDFSVIICAYTEDRWDDLVAAVESVHSQTLSAREIIVVIDHNPALLQRARVRLTGATVTENHETQGLSGARNSGIALAKGNLVAFMDEDAKAEPDWLERLSRHYEDAKVLGVGGAVESWWLSGRPDWFPEEFDWVVGCSYRGMPVKVAPVRNPIGCNMSFRRSVFETAGGFRHEIGRVGTRPVGDEETEIGIRTKRYWPDSVILYEPEARVHHRVPAHRANWRYFCSRCYSEGLSKAILSRIAGTADSLSSERTYTFQTLPHGVLRGMSDTFNHGNMKGLSRATAIVTGLAVTTTGYLVGTLAGWFGSKKNTAHPVHAADSDPILDPEAIQARHALTQVERSE